jgi:hypothetical protein
MRSSTYSIYTPRKKRYLLYIATLLSIMIPVTQPAASNGRPRMVLKDELNVQHTACSKLRKDGPVRAGFQLAASEPKPAMSGDEIFLGDFGILVSRKLQTQQVTWCDHSPCLRKYCLHAPRSVLHGAATCRSVICCDQMGACCVGAFKLLQLSFS